MAGTKDSESMNGGKREYAPPTGATKILSSLIGGRTLEYEAQADWIVLRKDEKPRAEMFYVRYFLGSNAGPESSRDRPLTFVFNGGPGASSVYLHVGALGPRRVDFTEHGNPLPPPHRLVDNDETWLQFSDLVFIDPVGTGFSRIIQEEKAEGDKSDKKDDKEKVGEYWKLQRDLESIGEFVRTFLSKFDRWESPIWIAGESYGGFRVAKLAKLLQQDYGVGLSGAIMLSPALEFTLLDGSDYDAMMWLDCFPTMAGAAAYHGRSRMRSSSDDPRSYMAAAASFGLTELLPVLAGGDLVGPKRRDKVLDLAADWIGLPRQTLRSKNGRVRIEWFVKNLLREQGLHLGLYDASLTVKDPFPDRDEWTGPDPTLHTVERVFASGINSLLRGAVGLSTDRDYALISDEVNEAWKIDTKQHALETQVGATDDLRYGMSLNPDMKVWISHGLYDLVTPFFATDRISRLLKIDEESGSRLTVKHYFGGHMFYTWAESRRAFFNDIRELYQGSSVPKSVGGES